MPKSVANSLISLNNRNFIKRWAQDEQRICLVLRIIDSSSGCHLTLALSCCKGRAHDPRETSQIQQPPVLIYFLLRCWRHHLILNGVWVRSPVQSAKSERIVQQASEALLREPIEVSRMAKVRTGCCIDTSEERLKMTPLSICMFTL